METYLPADKLALLYDVAEGSIRRWASKDKVRRIDGHGRRRLYMLDDMQAAYERRHPENAEQP